MALLLPQPMGPAALSLAEPPPFSSLIGRGGRGRGHGGGEALPGPPLHAGQANTDIQTQANKHKYHQKNTDQGDMKKQTNKYQ